jgi:hypothetical protein
MYEKLPKKTPRDVRMTAAAGDGDRIHCTVLDDGTMILCVKNRSVRDLITKPPHARHVTVEQMDS